MDRWQLQRAGMFNFWYYTDEVFELSEGRLVFRGANGAGKSVTMQSFIPLVLDGDKRPSRLDPFGSKDRKVAWYLLGDANSGHEDRTGYVYLEFHQPQSGKFTTVGIGLRARRGDANLGFWGFSLTDGRRIGHDFFLYDVDHFDKYGEKRPLDRNELGAAIGSGGGRVVREQNEYCQMVNQLLFGYDDIQSFKDMLNLLIQLRSPKLSKDFKPSTIYDILAQALPPLSDDELRPLTEVLEDLDEISDRLDELTLHLKSAEHLDAVYRRYNEMRLYEVAVQVMDADENYATVIDLVRAAEAELAQLDARIEIIQAERERTQAQLATTKMELAVIESSEAMEKQQELSSAEENQGRVNADIERLRQQLVGIEGEISAKNARLQEANEQLTVQQKELARCRAEMTRIATEIEFTDHAMYEERLNPDEVPSDGFWTGWQRDVDTYRKLLQQAQSLARQVSVAEERANTAEAQLSAAKQRRDDCEGALRQAQAALDNAAKQQEDELFAWYKGLRLLPLDDTSWREMLNGLQMFPDVEYEEVIRPAKVSAEVARADLQRQRLSVEHSLSLRRDARGELETELQTWRNQREPEPPRSEAREAARQRRKGAGGEAPGVPLFMVCEFRDDVDEPLRALLETMLHQTGLLDALVAPDGIDIGDGEEDAWLRPQPSLFGHTLADYLRPTPPDGSGLTPTLVDDVLRTITLGGSVADPVEPSAALVTLSGQYSIGPLVGRVAGKPRAEWIGYETRKMTRRAKMDELERAIAAVDAEMASLQAELQQIDEENSIIEAEVQALPPADAMKKAARDVRAASADVEQALRIELDCDERYKAERKRWRELQAQLMELTARWSGLKGESDFAAAIHQLGDYRQAGTECRSAGQLATRIRGEAGRLTEDLEGLRGRQGAAAEQRDRLYGRKRELDTRVETLRRLLKEMGALDLYEKIAALKREIARCEQFLEESHDHHLAAASERSAMAERLARHQQDLSESERAQATSLDKWMWECQLGLVNEEGLTMRASQSTGREDVQAFVRQLKRRLDSQTLGQLTQRLLDSFGNEKNTLLDFALESRYDDARGRWFIESLRDRNQPRPPHLLVAELKAQIEEQRLLIDEKDRELYEQILIHSVSRAIKDKIDRAEMWVKEMNDFMSARRTSSGLVLSLTWNPRPAANERELDTDNLVRLLRKSPETLRQSELEQMIEHFRSRIHWAKDEAEEGDSLRLGIQRLLDYRSWFSFTLHFKKGEQPRRELTDSQFNVLSGGEKAMAMYIPLFAATDSRFKDSLPQSPRIITLDEAFAGVDDENMRDMFKLLTDMGFDYLMTSQSLWGCYDTVPALSIYEIYRPNDVDFVTVIPYYWNGEERRMVVDGDWSAARDAAAAQESDPTHE